MLEIINLFRGGSVNQYVHHYGHDLVVYDQTHPEAVSLLLNVSG